MSSQSHVSHCRVLPRGEFTVTIPEPHATLQGAITWRNQCHDRTTLQGVRISFLYIKFVFAVFYFLFVFNTVYALTSSGFRIVSDTVIIQVYSVFNLHVRVLVASYTKGSQPMTYVAIAYYNISFNIFKSYSLLFFQTRLLPATGPWELR